MDILDDMGVSKLSAKVFLNVNYSFKNKVHPWHQCYQKEPLTSMKPFHYTKVYL